MKKEETIRDMTKEPHTPSRFLISLASVCSVLTLGVTIAKCVIDIYCDNKAKRELISILEDNCDVSQSNESANNDDLCNDCPFKTPFARSEEGDGYAC